MIAISSFVPNATGEIAENQQRARKSWLNVFGNISYFNNRDEQMAEGDRVIFVKGDDRPPIKEMMGFASILPRWCCLCNADIVVAQKFRLVEDRLKELGAKCAISRRFEFDPKDVSKPAKNVDLGLDIFCAIPEVWAEAAKHVPEQYVIGKQRFDTWILAFFMKHWPNDCYDFSKSAVIFHPKHGNRTDQSMAEHDPELVGSMTWPTKEIII